MTHLQQKLQRALERRKRKHGVKTPISADELLRNRNQDISRPAFASLRRSPGQTERHRRALLQALERNQRRRSGRKPRQDLSIGQRVLHPASGLTGEIFDLDYINKVLQMRYDDGRESTWLKSNSVEVIPAKDDTH